MRRRSPRLAGRAPCLAGSRSTLRPHELLHISGTNGTGKTTLLRVVCGLLRAEQGSVTWLGRSISEVRSATINGRSPMLRTSRRSKAI